MSDLPRFGGYQPKPKRNRELTDEQDARDRIRHVWPAVFIFGGLTVVSLIGFVVLSYAWSFQAAFAIFAIPVVAGIGLYIRLGGADEPD